MKKLTLLLSLSCLFLMFNLTDAKASTVNDEPVSENANATFDLEKLEKQEVEIDLPNGEKATLGIEPVVSEEVILPRADYTVGAGTHEWRIYYDAVTLASEFYATIYVPKSGYSEIKNVYGERPIRILGGSVTSEDLKLVRSKETSSSSAYAYYKIVTSWYNNTGSSSPTLKLNVSGKNITTDATGFFW